MASPGLPMPRAIGGCSLKQPTTFYPSLIHQMIYDTPSTVGGMHEAPSTLRANDDTIVDGLNNRLSRRQGNVGKIHSSGAT